ncbi:MAG: hypothetical protein ACRCZF_04960 [Gemmataceae bacterium]
MAAPTVICGILCVILGILGYTNATPNAEGKVSPTALIPAFLGGFLVLCGILAAALPNLRKHVMHFAAMLGLLGFFGGFAPLIRQAAKGNDFDPTGPAAINGLIMAVVCAVFVGLCVRSFIQARKAREARQAQEIAASAMRPS